MNSTIEQLQEITSAEELDSFLEDKGVTWQRLGGEDTNNIGIVDMGSEAEQAFFERVSNAQDAVIEKKALNRYGDIDTAINNLPNSPREAIKELYDISNGDLTNLDHKKRKRLADEIQLRLLNSGIDDRPTIDVNDNGIGQQPTEFTDTFLSLNSDNKNTKPFLIGRFGQGGTNVYRYAERTIIISRSHEGGPIGWTVVKREQNYQLEGGNRVSTYVYATNAQGAIFEIDASEQPEFEGSLIRMVEYYASDFSAGITSRLGLNHLRGLSGQQMFSSVLPLRVIDDRDDDDSDEHTVTGNRHVLDGSKYVDEIDGNRTQGTLNIPTDFGNLEVRYWIIDSTQSNSDLSTRQIIKKFVKPSKPLVFTLSGQLHHEEGKQVLTDANLGFLKSRIICEVNFDQLDEHERNLVFSSTRGRAAKGEEYDHIMSKLQDAFETNPRLQKLEEHYEEQVKRGSETDDDATDELAELMQSMDMSGDIDGEDLDGAEGSDSDDDNPGEEEPGTVDPYEPDPVDPRHHEPTRLDIVNPDEPIRVRQGGSLTLHVEIDAINKFDRRPDVEYEVVWSGPAGDALEDPHRSSLESGHKYLTSSVDDDVNIGATGQVTVRVSWGKNETRLDTRDLKIAEPIEQSPTTDTQGAAPPEIMGVGSPDDESPFTYGEKSTVHYRQKDGERDEVYVAMYNHHVDQVLDQVERSENNLTRYTSQYKAHMAFYATQRHKQMDTDGDDLSEDQLNAEQNRFANTLIQCIAKEVDPSELL